MKIEKIHYRFKYHLDSSNNEDMTLSVSIDPEESVSQVVESLRLIAKDLRVPSWWDVREKINDAEELLRKLETKIADRTRQWNELAEFLKTQGIKEDTPNFPLLPALPPPSVIQGEFMEEEEEEEEEEEDED